jgi:hypothetical protein
MKVERLERGFALTVPPGVTFLTTSRILLLSFAPVVEIRQQIDPEAAEIDS